MELAHWQAILFWVVVGFVVFYALVYAGYALAWQVYKRLHGRDKHGPSR